MFSGSLVASDPFSLGPWLKTLLGSVVASDPVSVGPCLKPLLDSLVTNVATVVPVPIDPIDEGAGGNQSCEELAGMSKRLLPP